MYSEYTLNVFNAGMEAILGEYMHIVLENNIQEPKYAYEGFLDRVKTIKWGEVFAKIRKTVSNFFKWIGFKLKSLFNLDRDMYYHKEGSGIVLRHNQEYAEQLKLINQGIVKMSAITKTPLSVGASVGVKDKSIDTNAEVSSEFNKTILPNRKRILQEVRDVVDQDHSKKAYAPKEDVPGIDTIEKALEHVQSLEGPIGEIIRRVQGQAQVWDTTKDRYDDDRKLVIDKRFSTITMAMHSLLTSIQQCVTTDTRILNTLIYKNSKDGAVYDISEFQFEAVP